MEERVSVKFLSISGQGGDFVNCTVLCCTKQSLSRNAHSFQLLSVRREMSMSTSSLNALVQGEGKVN